MRRIQIYMDEELDEALGVEAVRRRRSKAALIREYVGMQLRPRTATAGDALDEIVGSLTCEPVDDIDEAIYAQ